MHPTPLLFSFQWGHPLDVAPESRAGCEAAGSSLNRGSFDPCLLQAHHDRRVVAFNVLLGRYREVESESVDVRRRLALAGQEWDLLQEECVRLCQEADLLQVEKRERKAAIARSWSSRRRATVRC